MATVLTLNTGNELRPRAPNPTRVRERELLRVAVELSHRDARAATRSARDEILAWASRQVGSALPTAAVEGGSFEHLRGGRLCLGSSFEDTNRVLWALRVDRPDAHVAQRIWTTETVIAHAPDGGPARLGVRLLVSFGGDDALPVEPAVPALLRRVASACGLRQREGAIGAAAVRINTTADADALVDALTDPQRSVPYVVCSIAEGEQQPRIDADALARAMMGVARVIVLPAALTWSLTQRLGKALTTYNGAIRIYLPGFSFDANPYAHRLLFVDANDDASRQYVNAKLRWSLATDSLRRLRIDTDVIAFSSVRDASLGAERERLSAAGIGADEQLRAAQAQIDALREDLAHAKAETEQWMAAYEEADTNATTLERQLGYAQYRNQQLVAQLKAGGDEPDTGLQLPQEWQSFADWCDEALSGRITLSNRARRDLKSALFDDPQTAARCLLWLANEYRDSRLNGANGDLRKPLQSGIVNDRTGGDSFAFKWNDRHVQVDWHIKNGGNTHDPRRCLRIYYLWDEDSQTVVIVTMPGHIRTGAT